jgi:hypothetical protein
MRIARGLLLAVLEAASPALGTTRNLVPGLSHFWFDRENVTAFNDVLGIRVTFESDFTGGVEGERLLGLLKNSTANNVTLEARTRGRNPVLNVELGTTGVLLPMRPVAELLFHEKFPDDSRVFAVGSEFIDALKLTMLSCVAKKLASPAERGVTLIQKGVALDAFSTDDVTVSWVRVKEQSLFTTVPGRAIWPREFCDYFIRHFTSGTRVAIIGDAVWCTGGVPQKSAPLDVTVYAKLIEDNTPSDFAGFVRRYEGEVAVAFKIPDDLTHALSRAVAMVPEKSPIELEVATVTDPDVRVLRLYANSAAGEFDDLMEIDADGHADLTVRADAVLIRRALAGRTSLAITRAGVVLTGPPGFFHFISIRR